MTTFFVGGCSGSGSPASVRIERMSLLDSKLPVVPCRRTTFGTLTSAFGLIVGDVGIFVDNGTGIANINEFMKGAKLSRVYGLQTHTHHDHRSGVHGNMLLFKKGLVKEIFAPKLPGISFSELVERDFSPETWPVSPKDFGIELKITEFNLGEKLSVLGSMETLKLNHPGGNCPGSSAGYKINTPEGAIVIATDNELSSEKDREAYARFVSGAKILYADLQYRNREYRGERGICGGPPMSRKNWGHSTPEMLRAALEKCNRIPELVVLGHHDPWRTDEDLLKFEAEVHTLLSPLGCNVRFAREGDHFTL